MSGKIDMKPQSFSNLLKERGNCAGWEDTQRVVVLKIGGQFPTPARLHSVFYLVVRFVVFVHGGFCLPLVFSASYCWFAIDFEKSFHSLYGIVVLTAGRS